VSLFHDTIELAAEVGEFLAYFWPVTLCLGVNLLISGLVAVWKRRFTMRTSWMVLPLAPVTMILLWGSAFQYRGGPRGVASWAENCLYVFLVLDLALGVASTLKSRGDRWLAASAALASLWSSLLAVLVADMSISGASL
jgi:hypothetical protein